MRKRLILSSCLLIMVCTLQCAKRPTQARIERPVWNKGDVWQIWSNIRSHRNGVAHELSDRVTLRFEVVDNERVNGEECRVLRITSTDSMQAIYPYLSLELSAYYSVLDGSLKRVRTRRWDNCKLTEYDEHSPPGKSLLSFQLSLPFRVPLDIPQFPIREGGQPNEIVRYHPKANASDSDDQVVESSIVTTSDLDTVSGGKPRFNVKFLTRSLYSKSGQRDEVRVEEVWEGSKKWWTSATNTESGTVGKWSLAEEPARAGIERPVWNKGDSWRVKCPAYVGSKTGYKPSGYYTLVIQVMGRETVRGEECHVLKISSQPDYAVKSGVEALSLRYESYVYYRVGDLTVKRIRTDLWRSGTLEHYDEYSLPGTTMFGLGAMFPTMPIVLPQFPLAENTSVNIYEKQYEGVDGKPAPEGKPECQNRLESTKMDVVSTAGVRPSDGQASPSLKSVVGAVTVDFTRKTKYTSDQVTQRLLTQVWAPGHKWWSLARLADDKLGSIGAYVLEGGPVTPSK